MKNGQSRDKGNNGHKTQNEKKQQQKTQHRKLKTWATRTPPINREWTQVLENIFSTCFLKDTRRITHIQIW